MAVGFRLDVQEANHVKDREQRRARQEAYRRELNSQVADSEARREVQAQQLKELEERHELKSVRTTDSKLLAIESQQLVLRNYGLYAKTIPNLCAGAVQVCRWRRYSTITISHTRGPLNHPPRVSQQIKHAAPISFH